MSLRSGSVGAVWAGMCGGVWARIRGVKRVVRGADCAPSRSMQLGISMLGLSEAMLMGKKLGLDSELLGNIINTSTGQCWASSVSPVLDFSSLTWAFRGGGAGGLKFRRGS